MNCITIELCAEDRARIDRLTEALERKACDGCMASALAWAEQVMHKAGASAIPESAPAPVTPKNAAPAATTEQPAAVTPTEDNNAAPAENNPPPKPVSLAEFQKALSLRCAESATMKDRVRALIHEYAAAASQVPEDKRAEVLERLAKL